MPVLHGPEEILELRASQRHDFHALAHDGETLLLHCLQLLLWQSRLLLWLYVTLFQQSFQG